LASATRQPFAYALNNPVTITDPSGLFGDGYQMDWYLGSVQDVGSPWEVMGMFQDNPGAVFPFSLGQCKTISLGEKCNLGADPFGRKWPVQVDRVSSTSFRFCVLPGSQVDPPGSWIEFSIYEKGGQVYLRQTAHWNIHNPVEWAGVNGTEPFARATSGAASV
jgi:hypothetical protein